jgi:hypothetical protein
VLGIIPTALSNADQEAKEKRQREIRSDTPRGDGETVAADLLFSSILDTCHDVVRSRLRSSSAYFLETKATHLNPTVIRKYSHDRPRDRTDEAVM